MVEALAALAVAITGQVVGTLVASYIQRRLSPPTSALEIRPSSETVTVHRITVQFGPFAFERSQTETRIVGATFRLPRGQPLISSRWTPLLVGAFVAAAAVAIVLLVLL